MFDFLKRKKKAAAAAASKPLPSSSFKQSLLSLEQRLMFDAAAAATAAEVKSEQVAQDQAEAAVSTEASHETTGAEIGESQDVLSALASYMPTESRTEVVFVDPTVPDFEALVAGMGPNVEVVMLDAARDGVEQIAESLVGRTGIDAIHLISHGRSGELHLGTGTLTTESMSEEYAGEFATIREALSEHADLLVYGCDFAEGQTGLDAVQRLADLTGADVQASTDATGHISLGGDWEFEAQTGAIETRLAIAEPVRMNWAGILGAETVRDRFSAEAYSNNDGTQSWASNWSETDASGGGASGGDVRVNSGQLRIDTDRVGNQISRQVNLSGTSGATLAFDYSNSLTGADRIEARVSNDGGATYVTLAGGVFSNAANAGSGTATFDISAYASGNTRIQFIVTGTGGGDRLYVDNVQVSYTTGPANAAPTITSQGAGATASVTVAENSTAVTTVTASDVDAGQTLSYSIVGGSDAAQFTIDGRTGEVRFASASNYEAPTDSGGNNVYDVTVQVSDGNGGIDTQALAVTVADANEAPTDLVLSASTVAENAATGTVVGMITGTDVDAGDTTSYRLTDTAGGRFAIDSATGQLTVADGSLLNYESAASHNVTVRVTDRGGLTYDETFTITVTDVNEAPTVTMSGGSVQYNENAAPVVIDAGLTLSDVDSATMAGATVQITVAYNSSQDVLAFTNQLGIAGSWDSAAGTLTLSGIATVADYQTALRSITYQNTSDNPTISVRTVSFSVTDGTAGSAAATRQLQVVAWADAPVTDTVTASGPEDAAAVPVTLTGSDVDGTVNQFRLESLPANGSLYHDAACTLAVATGTDYVATGNALTLYFKPAADWNGGTTFQFSAKDDWGAYDATPGTATITVTPANDAPTDLSLSANTVAENAANGTVVGTVSGTDPDSGDTKTYRFTDSASGRFAINSSTGVITVADGSLLDYESAMSHSVTVRVTDSGGLTYDETFAINLTNVNEAPTALNLSGATVAENAVNGMVVGTVAVINPDAGDTHIYSLTSDAGGRFAVNASTGQITVADSALVNYGSMSNFNIVVRATDRGGRIHEQTFTISRTAGSLPGSLAPIALPSMGVHEGAGSSSPDPSNGETREGFRPPEDLRRSPRITTETPVLVEARSPERAPIRSGPFEYLGGSLENAAVEESLVRSPSRSNESGRGQEQTGLPAMRSGDEGQTGANAPEQQSGPADASAKTDVAMTVGIAGVVLQGGLLPKEKAAALGPRLRGKAFLSPAGHGYESDGARPDGSESGDPRPS